MPRSEHDSMRFGVDQEGWDFAICECGWISPPSPGRETAAEFWADHISHSLDGQEASDA